jgi:hypothetical protein
MKLLNINAPEGKVSPPPSWITSKRPWDEARKLKIMRYGHSKNEPADPGVNYFLLVLEELGAKPKTSCEGHPYGFNILFKASFEVAIAIQMVGYFDISFSSMNCERPQWCRMTLPDSWVDEREKTQTLRQAAAAWKSEFYRGPASSDMKK